MNRPTTSCLESQKTIGDFLAKDNYKSPHNPQPPPHIFAEKIPVLKMWFNRVKRTRTWTYRRKYVHKIPQDLFNADDRIVCISIQQIKRLHF